MDDTVGSVLGAILARIKATTDLKADEKIYQLAGVGRGQVERAKDGGSLSKKARNAFLLLVPDHVERDGLRERLEVALVARRRSSIGKNAADTPLDVLRDTIDKWDSWLPRAFALLETKSLPLRFPSGSAAQDVYVDLVNEARRTCGEKVAFRNALLLMRLCLEENRMANCQQELSALDAVWTAYDLAAQFGNPLWLKFVRGILEKRLGNLRGEPARLLHKRMVLECKALDLTYTKRRDGSVDNVEKADALLGEAAAAAAPGLAEPGISESFPSLFKGWGGVFVNRINGGVTLGRSFAVQKALFADYDRAFESLHRGGGGPNALPGDILDSGVTTDLWMANTLAEIAMARDGAVDGGGRLPAARDQESLDLAIRRVDTALAARSPEDNGTQTIVAALHLDKAEAILRTYRHAWTPARREEYWNEKRAAACIYRPLGMLGKLGRMTRIEAATDYRWRK